MTEHGNTCLTELIRHARRQSRFGTYNTEIDGLLFGKSQQGLHIRISDIHTTSQLRDTGIPRCTENLNDLFTAAQLIHNGVLTTTGTYDEYFFHA